MIRSTTLVAVSSLVYAGVSITWSPGVQAWAATWLGSLALCFILGAKLPSLRLIWTIYISLVLLYLAIQFWLPFQLSHNVLASAIVLALAAAVVYEHWLFIPFGLLGLWQAQSRGAFFAAGAVGLAALWPTRFKATALIAFIGGIIAAEMITQDRVGHVFIDSMAQRLGIWQDTTEHLTLFGHGLGSFGTAYASWPVHRNMTAMTTAHAYNDFLELIFDLGIGAIPLWLLVAMCCEAMTRMRLIVFAYFCLSLTFFPLFVPILGHLVALTLGRLSQERTHHALALA